MLGDPGHQEFPKAADYLNCSSCGCPNKNGDIKCSFCNEPLSSQPGISERIRRAVETMKWRYKMKSGNRNAATMAKQGAGKVFTLILGIALSLLGGWFFIRAATSASFSEFLIGALFLLYGVYSLIHTIRPGSD